MITLNRVLFCTSPLQIINTRSSMEELGSSNSFNDYVVITQPSLNNSVKKVIVGLSNEMGFKKVLDLSYLINQNSSNFSSLPAISKIFGLKKYFVKKINTFENCSSQISIIINKEIGPISSLFFRANYNTYDSLFINCFNDSDKYVIEDGFADYIPNYWAFKHLNFYEIKHAIRNKLKSTAYFVLGVFFTRKIRLCKKYFLKSRYKILKRFTNIQTHYSECISTYYKDNIKKLNLLLPNENDPRVIIIGTLIDSRFDYNIDDEIELYNKLIQLIRNKYKLTNNEIWYKPHPRIDYKSWLKKKSNLACSIYEHEDSQIIDISLCNKNIKAVYSIASTSLLYAKKIFNIDSFWIDIRSKPVHPSAFEKAFYVSKKYNIKSIRVS